MNAEDARVLAFLAELGRDWEQVRVQLGAACSVEPRVGPAQAALVALSLDHAYQAFENMLVRIERALGLADRSGAGWHRAVLSDATVPIPGLRPAIVPADIERDWDDLRRFRHFLRHAYSAALDPQKLVANRARLERAVAATDPVVRALVAALALAGEKDTSG